MSLAESRQTKNKVLLSLPDDEYERVSRHLEPVNLERNKVLHEPEETIREVYFLNDALISILSLLSDGSTIEIGVVGREGLSDTSALLGSDVSPHQSLVQLPGSAFRMKVGPFKEELRRGGKFQQLLLRYASLLIAQISQVAVCNSLHTIEERLSRWLLTSATRVESNELPLTQEFLSHMLGVRRAGVTVAARTLQTAELIKYNRGHITIIDFEGLESTACECYENMKEEFRRYIQF
ncbi:MAG: Crp/Fnr family transcriptional regulator [Acidobacteriota bacterium]|nr:Crp/Fnr family transcriptional regulator [Acidobacteriota bacterium]